MRRISFLWTLSVFVVGSALGLGSAWLAAMWLPGASTVTNGVWTTDLTIGSAAADPYLRARVAVSGVLALNKSETLYYTADTDASGAPLSSACVYRIEGRDPAARWWSMTAYGPDFYLIANPADLYSESRTTVTRGPDGGFVIRVARAAQAGDWIPLGDADRFRLTLRLYNPDPSVVAAPDTAALPRLIKESCS